jgi:tRNA modification GTPase
MSSYDDTIAAIATAPGEGGIGIVRVSGNDALPIARRVFHPHTPGPYRPYRLRYGHVVDPDTRTVIDEALLAFMQAPRSFTSEDVIELSVHGGMLVVQRTLDLVLAAGARLANPGEFTLRAFLNGRIDLSQAEATLDVIRAQTSAGLALAQEQLGGWLAQEVRRIRGRLLEALAYVTVLVDFPEDEIERQDILLTLREEQQAVEQLLATANYGIIYRQGARVVLVGRPNVGKSSLLNSLLRSNRAIVTPIPGTTRDTLEEMANLAGIPVVLTDTAGITESVEPVEQIGVERSHAALAQADLVLLVFDHHEPLSAEDQRIAAITVDKPTLLVWNKADLPPPPAGHLPLPFAHPRIVGRVETSVVTGAGIAELANEVGRVLLGGEVAPGGAHLVTNPRHCDALRRATESLGAAIESQEADLPTDLVAGELTTALNALGEIIGATIGDDLLDTIFSRFCIGK